MEDKTEIFAFLKDASDKMSVIFHNYILEYKEKYHFKPSLSKEGLGGLSISDHKKRGELKNSPLFL